MKRSEMIEIIIGTITQEGFRQQLEDGVPSVEKMADVLLDQLEFSGMLPPKPKNALNDGWSVSDYEWESEDD